jgi:hypothetical protein
MSHQKAALTIITTLYTPERMLVHESLRKVFHWYARFDIFIGILSGTATQLDREWFSCQEEFYKQKRKEHPESLAWKYEEKYAWIRLTGYDLRMFMRKKAQGELSDEEFEKGLQGFDEQLKDLHSSLAPALTDPSKRIADISEGRTKAPNDIVDPYEPNVLYGGELYNTNVVLHDLIVFELLYKNQIGEVTGKLDVTGIREVCLKQCQLYEAATLYSGSPPGIRFGMQAGLAFCLLFLRANEQEIWWARKRLAEIETKG